LQSDPTYETPAFANAPADAQRGETLREARRQPLMLSQLTGRSEDGAISNKKNVLLYNTCPYDAMIDPYPEAGVLFRKFSQLIPLS
jgi:hypothetical protein